MTISLNIQLREWLGGYLLKKTKGDYYDSKEHKNIFTKT